MVHVLFASACQIKVVIENAIGHLRSAESNYSHT